MPDKLQQKLVNHFDYLFNVQFGKLEFEILDQLPKSLRSEVLKLNIPLIQNHPFLKGSADNMFLLEEMTKILLPRTVSPNEDVVRRGAPVSAIYFVRSGKVNVLSPTDDKSTVTSLLNGDHFGTFEFFFGATSTYSYRTATFSDLLLVGRQDFEHMMENPRFDFEARLIDLTVGYINSNLKPVDEGGGGDGAQASLKEEEEGEGREGAEGELTSNIASKEFLGELEHWLKKEQVRVRYLWP